MNIVLADLILCSLRMCSLRFNFGLFLLLIYTNDLSEGLKAKVKLFAEDTSTFINGNDPDESSDKLSDELKVAKEWMTR